MIASFGRVNPIEVFWTILMAGVLFFEIRLLLIAKGDERYIESHKIDHFADVIVEGDVGDLWLRLTGTVALLAIGALSLFIPEPIRDTARISQAVSLVMFLYFGAERLICDVRAYRRRRKLLAGEGYALSARPMGGGETIMNKNTPGARFVRTFLQLMAGVAAGAALIDWATDYKQGAVFVALGTIAAVIGAVIALLMAMAAWKATTPFMKGIVTFAQLMAAGLGTLAINDWTNAAFISFGQAFVRLIVGSVVAAVAAFAQNAAEDRPERINIR